MSEKMPDSDDEKLARMTACPTRYQSTSPCRCGPCAKCGFGPHMAVHLPPHGKPADSPPWGHAYVARNK